jgi:hypothetical protein
MASSRVSASQVSKWTWTVRYSSVRSGRRRPYSDGPFTAACCTTVMPAPCTRRAGRGGRDQPDGLRGAADQTLRLRHVAAPPPDRRSTAARRRLAPAHRQAGTPATGSRHDARGRRRRARARSTRRHAGSRTTTSRDPGFRRARSGSATIFAPRGIVAPPRAVSPTICQRSGAFSAARASSGLPTQSIRDC